MGKLVEVAVVSISPDDICKTCGLTRECKDCEATQTCIEQLQLEFSELEDSIEMLLGMEEQNRLLGFGNLSEELSDLRSVWARFDGSGILGKK